MVLRNLPANCTAVGVPAEVVRINNKAVNPADDLDQQDLPDIVAQRLTDLTAVSAHWKTLRRATPRPQQRRSPHDRSHNDSECLRLRSGHLQRKNIFIIEQQRTACGLSAVAFSRKGSKRET